MTNCHARSVDGRRLSLRLDGPGPGLLPGDLVVAEAVDASYLAQVVQPPVPASVVEPALPGTGRVIGRLGDDLVPDRAARAPFADAPVTPAGQEHLEALLDASGADLPIGS